jgi:ankyrin repeat protein
MQLFRLRTSRLALILSLATLATHVGLGFLLLAGVKNPTFAEVWQRSTKVYWPALGLVQMPGFATNADYIGAIAILVIAALFQWWVIYCAGIWTVRLYFRDPPISKAARFGIPVLALVAAVLFYEATPETLGMSKYQRFRFDVSGGQVERVRDALRAHPGFANKVQPAWGTALHEAARSGRTNTAELLLKNGSDVNARNEEGETPLHIAAKWGGHVDVSRLLIVYKADVNATDKDGKTPLWSAAAAGYTNLIELLLQNGANVNVGISPLLGAIMNNRYEVVPLLLAHGASPTASDLNGDDALDRAALQGSPALAELLLPYFKDTNSTRYLSKAFSAAFKYGHMDVAISISVSALRFESNSIHQAAFSGDADNVSAAISSQPELLNAKDFLGLTPLHRAAQAGKDVVIKLLMSQGTAVDSTDQSDSTPLHWAVFSGQSNVVGTLIANRANLNAMNGGEMTPLDLAIQQGFLSISKMLLEAGSDPNIAAKHGATALSIAVAAGNVEAVKLLLASHARSNINIGGDTLFHIWAETTANPGVADLLLASGCDVNAKGREGRRPLHALLEQIRFQPDQKGQLEAVQWLLDHNVDVNARNDKGQTPLSLLKWKNRGRTIERRKDIGDLLRGHGATE